MISFSSALPARGEFPRLAGERLRLEHGAVISMRLRSGTGNLNLSFSRISPWRNWLGQHRMPPNLTFPDCPGFKSEHVQQPFVDLCDDAAMRRCSPRLNLQRLRNGNDINDKRAVAPLDTASRQECTLVSAEVRPSEAQSYLTIRGSKQGERHPSRIRCLEGCRFLNSAVTKSTQDTELYLDSQVSCMRMQ